MLNKSTKRSWRDKHIRTGFSELDRELGLGLPPSSLVVLSSSSNAGKNAFALNIAVNVARNKNNVVIFNSAMDQKSLMDRILASEADVDLSRVEKFLVSDIERKHIMAATGAISELPIVLDTSRGYGVLEIQKKCREFHKVGRVDLAIVDVDSLHDIEFKDRYEDNPWELEDIANGLKRISMELDIPVLAVSNFSLVVEQELSRKPRLYDLDSSFTGHSDLVMFIYRETLGMTDEQRERQYPDWDSQLHSGNMELMIAKHREGPAGGTIGLWFDGSRMRFKGT